MIELYCDIINILLFEVENRKEPEYRCTSLDTRKASDSVHVKALIHEDTGQRTKDAVIEHRLFEKKNYLKTNQKPDEAVAIETISISYLKMKQNKAKLLSYKTNHNLKQMCKNKMELVSLNATNTVNTPKMLEEQESKTVFSFL